MNCAEVNVIIIGGVHHNTLGVLRSLSEAGVPQKNLQVIIVAKETKPKNIISASKYIDSESISYLNEYSQIVPLLKKAQFDEKKVIICCSDGTAEAVMSAKEELLDKYKMPALSMNVTELMVKSKQAQIAVECGMNVPVSGDFVVDQNIDWNIFPCIIKPYKSVEGAGKADIRVVSSKKELLDIVLSLKAGKIQIQQYIDKAMEFQLIGCSLDAGKTIIIPGFTNIIRQPKNTNTGYLVYSPIEELVFDYKSIKDFIQTIGYSGLFSIEFIRGKDGKDYFLEINMRNDGNAYCVTSAGVNLPYIWTYYQCYEKIPPIPTSFKKAIHFIPDFNDLKVSIKKIGIVKWLKEFRQAESHSIYNKNDMGPFRFEFMRQIKKLFNHQ